MIENIKILVKHRELLLTWTKREIGIRYKQSFLGAAWAMLQPLSLMIVFTVVFSLIIPISTNDIPYPVFSYIAVLSWTFFANSVTLGTPSLVNNMTLVTKVSLPREILSLSVVLASFVDFLVASSIYAGLLLFFHIKIHWTLLWIFPLLGIQVILTVGVVLLFSALNVLFRDIRFIIPLLTLLWMYATPIVYPIDLVPNNLRPFYLLNPMAVVVDGLRKSIILGLMPDIESMLVAFIISVVLLIFAYRIFKSLEPSFADII